MDDVAERDKGSNNGVCWFDLLLLELLLVVEKRHDAEAPWRNRTRSQGR